MNAVTPNPKPKAPNPKVGAGHKRITSDRVTGTPVFNKAGERMGHIQNLSIDKTTGQVSHVLMSFGGFLGIGERFHPIPWKVLKYDVEMDGYVVALSKDKLKNAPSYTSLELEAFGGGDSYAPEIYAYYGVAPYW